jgi:membrane-associated phospholipid phosphatase
MTCRIPRGALVVAALLAAAPMPAFAQSATDATSRCAEQPASTGSLLTGTAGGLRRLPARRETWSWLAMGAVAAGGARLADQSVSSTLASARLLEEPLEPGAIIGGTPLQLGAALTTYAIGRATHSPCAVAVAADLVRAQLMGEALAFGLKQTFRRSRPEGTGFSFPSGHTTVSFASATVLQHHFGWKVGIPAYAAATYVAASRVQMKRHYFSDVAFGAALGMVAGRTVTVGRHRLLVSPQATAGGAAASFTWIPR